MWTTWTKLDKIEKWTKLDKIENVGQIESRTKWTKLIHKSK